MDSLILKNSRLEDVVVDSLAQPHIMERVERELGSKFWETSIYLLMAKENTRPIASLLKSEIISRTIPESRLKRLIKKLLELAP